MTIRATHDTAERIRELTEKLCEKTSSKVNTAETLTLMVDFLAGNNRKSKDYTDQMVEIMLINRVIQADRSVFCHGSAQIAENSEGGGRPLQGRGRDHLFPVQRTRYAEPWWDHPRAQSPQG